MTEGIMISTLMSLLCFIVGWCVGVVFSYRDYKATTARLGRFDYEGVIYICTPIDNTPTPKQRGDVG